ncbi:MAG: RNHCP domain-containing protein [bacterium]|nr:RNHCP domain-containing protein [bacterium]
MSFTRTIEDFKCERCGAEVKGTGYTNHCPKCLWSKHVDVEPGDRAATCAGLMEPVAVAQKKGEWVIEQRCTKCGFTRNQSAQKEDNLEVIIELSRGKS